MELLCCEGEQLRKAILDPVFLEDRRVLQNLLKLEEHYLVSSKYMEFQTDVKPYMRKVVTQWMLEVCEEQRCEEDVFPLAVNFMDRFLASYADLKRNRLQLLATACMFLASKLKETYPLSAEKLVIYTDKSITLQELLDWELLVLCKLKWDISAVSPHDFVDILIHRLAIPADFKSQVRKLTVANLSSCILELELLMCPPSLLACGCLCASLASLHRSHAKALLYCHELHKISGLDLDMMRSTFDQIFRLVNDRPTVDLATAASYDQMSAKEVTHPGTPTDTLSVEVN